MQSTTQRAEEMQRELEEVQVCGTSIWIKKDNEHHELKIVHKRGTNAAGEWRGNKPFTHITFFNAPSGWNGYQCCGQSGCPTDIPDAFSRLKTLLGDFEPILDTLIVDVWSEGQDFIISADDGPNLIGPDNKIYQCIRDAWCELFGISAPPPVTPSASDPLTRRKELVQTPLLALLNADPPKISEFNARPYRERTFAEFGDLDFSKKTLPEVDISGMDWNRSKFDSCNLSKADFTGTQLVEASFTNAKLDKVKFQATIANHADFTGAKLAGANMKSAILSHAKFKDADLSKVSFAKTDLRQVDLSDCKTLDGAKFKGAFYDESTKFPPGFADFAQMSWRGRGPDPYKTQTKKDVYASGEIDFDGLIKHLEKNFDKERLKKALSMLKKESFQLFSEVGDQFISGIVKSQSDANLVYGCRLLSDGSFSCCTQNLNACGGLRGALCKHILVLVIGLARNNDVTTTNAAHWVIASLVEKPKVDKDIMTELFLKYSGAESGEIDWRPTETIPEDYYAF